MKASLEIFKQIPDSVVFSIRDDESKRIFINETKNGVYGISRFINEYPKLLELSNDIEIHHIETNDSYRKHYVATLMDKYKELGYEILNPKKPLQFVKARIRYANDKFNIELSNNRRNKEVVGEFDNYPDAKAFFDEHYASAMPYPLVLWL